MENNPNAKLIFIVWLNSKTYFKKVKNATTKIIKKFTTRGFEMTSELLVSTLTPIVSVVVANSYIGTAKYITYNYADTKAELFDIPISETDYFYLF